MVPETSSHKTIVFLGASLTSGYGLPASDAFPGVYNRLLQTHGKETTLYNVASPGASSRDGLLQLEKAIKSGISIDYLFIALGISDAVYNTPCTNIKKNLSAVIKRAKDHNPDITIYLFQGKIFQRHVTSRVAKANSPYEKEYEALFPEICNKEHVTLLPFLLDPIQGKMEFFQSDQLHPNKSGAVAIAKHVWNETRLAFDQ